MDRIQQLLTDKSRPKMAKIVKDSISPRGNRLVTMEVTMHRFVLAEFNTHRVFSRNAASSRAIPFAKRVSAMIENDWSMPLFFGKNQSGMQANAEIEERFAAEEWWRNSGQGALVNAEFGSKSLNLHKQIVNRVIEPYSMVTVLMSATEFDGFFWQRCHPDAQPEIQIPAYDMQYAYYTSKPTLIGNDEYHRPYILGPDVREAMDLAESYSVKMKRRLFGQFGSEEEIALDTRQILNAVSVARCSRVSYMNHEGKRALVEDLGHYARLMDRFPPHASPLEHVAMPSGMQIGNFVGWLQLRHKYLMNLPKFQPNHPLLENS